MDKETKLICADAMTQGLALPVGSDIMEITMDVWEKVNTSSRPMLATFNMYGNSSKVTVTGEDEKSVLDIYIGPSRISFSLTKPLGLYTMLEKEITGWSTFETVGVYSLLIKDEE